MMTEERLVLDLGVCPYCGAEFVYEARDGRAIGRKPPETCCREQAVDREGMNALREDMERIQRKLKEL